MDSGTDTSRKNITKRADNNKEMLLDKISIDEAGVIKPVQPTKPTPPANPSQSAAQQPATQADEQKSKSITQRIRTQNPTGVQIDQIPNLVQQNANALGIQDKDIPMMVDLVKKQLGVGQPQGQN